MNNLDRILRFSLFLLIAASASMLLAPSGLRADSFSYTPDTLTFSPTSGQDSVVSYVRIAYTGDTSGPGTYVHGWISSGGSYFSAASDTMHITGHNYIRIVYHVQSSAVTGQLSISDDTVTHTVVLIGHTAPQAPALTAIGPYFPYIPEGTDTCTHLTLINSSSSPDTIHSVGWSHNPNGIFTWDSVSLPYILAAGDTTYWTYCFHAPDNTTTNFDTLRVYYGSGDANVSRIVYGVATSPLSLEGPYFPSDISEGGDTCTQMRIINTSGTADTLESIGWAHNSNGVFVWDTASLPAILGAHDTTYYTFCFHAPNNTATNIDTIVLSYHSSSGNGNVSRLVEAASATPPNDLSLLGPYFPQNTPEGADTCVSMRLINTTGSADTIESVTWAHNSNGIFVWDTTALPTTLAAHDTAYFTFCFHAPDNTETNIDTISVLYHNGSVSSYATRLVYAAAALPPPDLRVNYPYFASWIPENYDTCSGLPLINTGSSTDTITGIAWSHNPNGIFTWDSTSLPITIAAHDTVTWRICFQSSDTSLYRDTLTVYYRDASHSEGYAMCLVSARATDTNIRTCYILYPNPNPAPTTNIGDTSYVHLYVSNRLSDSATLESFHFSGSDDGAFRIDTAGNVPHTVPGHGYDSVWVRFIPNRTTGSIEYNATLTATFQRYDSTDCYEASVALYGYMPQSCSDTESVSLDTTGTKDVSLSGDSGRYYAHRIDFVNNSSSTVIVSAVNWLHSSSHFLVAQIVPALPDTLAPSEGMAIIIHFYGDTSGTIYLDTLALTIQSGITERSGRFTPLSGNPNVFYVNFKGISNAAPASVAESAPNAPNLLLYPNPSTGIVNMELDGTSNASFEVIDVLGNIIAAHSGAGVWQWDANAMGLRSNGTYFVRASNGNEVTTKRLVLQR